MPAYGRQAGAQSVPGRSIDDLLCTEAGAKASRISPTPRTAAAPGRRRGTSPGPPGARELLDDDRLVTVAYRQHDVLPGRVVQILHVRQGVRAQAVAVRRE
jgi:hypothetical protein